MILIIFSRSTGHHTAMRELRKDIDSRLESSSKDEIDPTDEIKIEDVIMGLKGLKQEEVFSLLGKSNFNPNETEVSFRICSIDLTVAYIFHGANFIFHTFRIGLKR